ncbi:MAG: LL-diaminopimelate aminotransferase [Phycisphaerae bacterium]|nr:LL-diaminopimelate aminotransferase [Phycisphaerae bacterium]
MAFTKSQRLQQLPPYLFVEIDKAKRAAVAAGKDVINLGVGDPDQPTPKFIIERMHTATEDPKNHRYPFDEGVPEFRRQAAAWFARRFGVTVDADKQLITLIGSKEGIAKLPLAVLNPGDVSLVPQPGYPVYNAASIFAGGQVHHMPLTHGNGWLPDLDAIPAGVAKSARLMFLNYPNNPTAAVAPLPFFAKAVAFAKRHDILICQDAAYSEMWYETPPPSIFQVPGAMDVAVEMHSLSKTFNMTGWRLGFAVGNEAVIAALAQVKSNMDSGQFNAIQQAGLAAIAGADRPEVAGLRDMYRQRRDALVDGLTKLGWKVDRPAATFYVWIRCPEGVDSMTTTRRLLAEANVVTIPGVGLGKPGQGYIRAALTVATERIAEAVERIAKVNF